MNAVAIARRFRALSYLWVLFFIIAAKLLYIAYRITAADVTFHQLIPLLCRYGAATAEQAGIAMATAAVVYAISFFGKRTALFSAVFSLICFISGEAVLFVYNMIRNVLSRPVILAALLADFIEVLFTVLLLLLAFGFGFHYAKRRFSAQNPRRLTRYAPLRASFAALTAVFLVRLAELSAFHVIPFFVQFTNVTGAEIRSILGDYLYYAVLYLAMPLLLTWISMFFLKKCTGELRPKEYLPAASSECADK